MIVNSGTRGTLSQTQQLLGLRGYVVGFNGQQSRIPILNSYNEGLSLIQLFCCTYSSRRGINGYCIENRKFQLSYKETCWINKGMSDRWDGFCTKDGLCVDLIIDLEFIKNRLIGRFLLRDILSNGMVMARKNELIIVTNISEILICCGNQLLIRSPLTCQATSGICKFCYGIE